jgi:hypothetical protein
MDFDREALRGIFQALTHHERYDIEERCARMGVPVSSPILDEHLPLVQRAMVDLGYIMSFKVSDMQAAADEYEDICKAQELMKCE